MAQDPYKYFRPEARDLLDQFAQGRPRAREGRGGAAAAVQQLLRLAHTLKGAARVVKQAEIANRAHAIEDALAPFRDCADSIAREQIDAILAASRRDRQPDRHARADRRARRLAAPGKHRQPTRAPRTVRTDRRRGRCRARRRGGDPRAAERPARRVAGTSSRRGTWRICCWRSSRRSRPTDHGRQSAATPASASRSRTSCAARFGGVERNLGSIIDQMDRELAPGARGRGAAAPGVGRKPVHRARAHGARYRPGAVQAGDLRGQRAATSGSMRTCSRRSRAR